MLKIEICVPINNPIRARSLQKGTLKDTLFPRAFLEPHFWNYSSLREYQIKDQYIVVSLNGRLNNNACPSARFCRSDFNCTLLMVFLSEKNAKNN